MSRPGELLQADRALLHPNFETYKLHALDTDEDVSAFPLPGSGATQSRVGHSAQQLGFKEVRARISHNHLDTMGNRGIYIDVDWNVVGFEINDGLQPTFSQLASLPAPISKDEHAEYPRAVPLTPEAWAVSSGSGSLYMLRTSAGGEFSGEFTARYDLVLEDGIAPFLVVSAHVEGTSAKLLLARPVVEPEAGSSRWKARQATFALAEVEVDTAHVNGGDSAPEQLTPKWTLSGNDLPYWAAWADSGWVVLADDTFTAPTPESTVPETETERATREHNEKVAKLGLGAILPEADLAAQKERDDRSEDAMEVDTEAPKHPFRWTQDTSSVTITVPVPATRKDIDVKISPETLLLSLKADVTPPLAGFVGQPHAFWTEVVADESTWTFDASKGEVEIELQKADGDTLRWPSVFIPDDDSDTEDVPETFAPSTLAAFRESFSHAVRTRDGDDELPSPVAALPALLREDMDLDFDDDEDFGQRTEGAFADLSAGSVGRSVLIGFVSDGIPTWSRQPASVVSLPVTAAGPDSAAEAGIIVKAAVDGLVFSPPHGGNPSRTPWVHTGTNPALAFVISSKRDLRLVRHVSTTVKTGSDSRTGTSITGAGSTSTATVFAFDSGSGTGNGNVYIYYGPAAGQQTVARQGVVSVAGGDRGALLGVGCVNVGGRQVVVALCESALAVLGGVL